VTEQIETVIVGGGQAGLVLSYHLGQLGLEHILLERGRLVERWRSQRWDSLAFQFPNWTLELPGYGYAGNDPDGFAPRDEVVRFLERYAALVKAPVRSGVTVRAIRQKPGSARYLVGSDDGVIEAANVVLATGPYQEPAVPSVSASLPHAIVQVHSASYRNPASLPPGAVLVVGSGSSGCQIVEDLLESGLRVYLSVGRHRRLPRRYRGRDVFWWLGAMGVLDQTVDRHPEGKSAPNPLFTGVRGGHDIDLHRYVANGVVLLGHVRGASESRLALAQDIEDVLARGDEAFVGFKRSVDDFVQRTGNGPPEEPAVQAAVEPPTLPPSPTELDLERAGVTAVIWATGFRFDFGWVVLPVFDEHGQPAQRRGVTRCPGIFFLGLPWMHKLKSSVLCGVGEDAAYLAEQIAARHGRG
jgi:putative flavoprotein involved in K+ transport